ncbi:MAG: class I tRNA ligase family protein, partial [Planctomycetota bacterium]|nr:class I tRNA ligase family protein [Planctomycetota bacterium]
TSPEAQNLIGMDRFEARQAVVEWLRKENLLEDVREYVHQVGHSYRSHVPIEPYLSDQWYIWVKKPISNLPISNCEFDVEERDGVTCAEGTDVPVNSLAGLALAPLLEGRLRFIPERYAKTYQSWLENLRDWPISRQLWWGHRIPIWSYSLSAKTILQMERLQGSGTEQTEQVDASEIFTKKDWDASRIAADLATQYPDRVAIQQGSSQGFRLDSATGQVTGMATGNTMSVCLLDDDPKFVKALEDVGFQQNEDVLDTWFSSALWPFSTMGWPAAKPEWLKLLKTFYPGDVLCTAREIITLWVTRMVMMGQYCVGDIPFSDVFIHAMIQDGEGRKMSKSLGNGIDPLDIIDSHGADAMRFTLVSMTTQTQDVRMPVRHMALPDGRQANTSEKFDIGRNFCNKLWNAARFALMNLEGCPAWSDIEPRKHLPDRWILSRLNTTVRDATEALENYHFNELVDTIYHFMWDDFCDWYLEIAKVRINAGKATPKAILAHCLDVLLRLLHPVAPFITEAIWSRLNEAAPVRSPGDQQAEEMLVQAEWPRADAGWIDPTAEKNFDLLQEWMRNNRNVRKEHNAPPRDVLVVKIQESDYTRLFLDNKELIESQTNSNITIVPAGWTVPPDSAFYTVEGINTYVEGIIDRDAEIARLSRQADTLNKGIKGIEAKLGNAKFLSKAPTEVVQRERERLDALKADLAAVEKSLEAQR